MPITVNTTFRPTPPDQDSLVITGITTTNEHIIQIHEDVRSIVCTYNPTVAGTARIKYVIFNANPTDFSDMNTTIIGDVTAADGQELPAGINWIGLEVDSGTWDFTLSLRTK